MRSLLPLFVLLASCVTDGPVPDTLMEGERFDFPADHALPMRETPPPPMTLVAGPLVPGTPFILTAFGANPGDEVWFVRSPDLGTACFPRLPECLSIDSPIILTSVVADASGIASLLVPIPRSIPVGGTMHFQAGVLGRQAGYVSSVASATSESVCGDLIVQTNEDCDDGNDDNTDGCSNSCTIDECGDGVIQGAETCDDGNGISGDGCDDTCMLDRFDLEIFGAEINSVDALFDPWDSSLLFGFEDPDTFIEIYRNSTLVGTTVVESDTLLPQWNTSVNVALSPGDSLTLRVLDEDTLFHDFVDDVVVPYADMAAFTGQGVVTLDGAEGFVFDMDIRVRPATL